MVKLFCISQHKQLDRKRIVYRSAKGGKVEIKGSEVIKGWQKVQGDVWKVILPNSFFGSFNPYRDLIRGDWFNPLGRNHHTGAVYLNGDWLNEAATLDEASRPGDTARVWYGQVDAKNTTIWARFTGADPGQNLVEINVRQTVFFPETTGINYITVRGFTMRHAATNWAPPTAVQVGLIGPHWSKGWVIEKILAIRGSTINIPSRLSIFLAVKRELTVPIPSVREKALSKLFICLRFEGERISESLNSTIIMSCTPNSCSIESVVSLEGIVRGI